MAEPHRHLILRTRFALFLLDGQRSERPKGIYQKKLTIKIHGLGIKNLAKYAIQKFEACL
jgi:hypothetical protein